MLRLVSLIFLIFSPLISCFNTEIDLDLYRCCKEVVYHGEEYGRYSKYQNIVPLQDLSMGNVNGSLRVRFYFQGRADFSVALLPKISQPSTEDQIVHTLMAYGSDNNRDSTIFLNSLKTNSCQTSKIPNPFHNFYFTQLELILDMKVGYMMWMLEEKPFLTCLSPNIKNLKYIGFNGWSTDKSRYFYDCENE